MLNNKEFHCLKLYDYIEVISDRPPSGVLSKITYLVCYRTCVDDAAAGQIVTKQNGEVCSFHGNTVTPGLENVDEEGSFE
jgi:hypothetical protein